MPRHGFICRYLSYIGKNSSASSVFMEVEYSGVQLEMGAPRNFGVARQWRATWKEMAPACQFGVPVGCTNYIWKR